MSIIEHLANKINKKKNVTKIYQKVHTGMYTLSPTYTQHTILVYSLIAYI